MLLVHNDTRLNLGAFCDEFDCPSDQHRRSEQSMRSALLLFLLPGLAATDNAICAVLSPKITQLMIM